MEKYLKIVFCEFFFCLSNGADFYCLLSHNLSDLFDRFRILWCIAFNPFVYNLSTVKYFLIEKLYKFTRYICKQLNFMEFFEQKVYMIC